MRSAITGKQNIAVPDNMFFERGKDKWRRRNFLNESVKFLLFFGSRN